MAKQSLISIPTSFRDLSQARRVILKLVEELDKVLGFRGAGTIASIESVTVVTKKVTELEESVGDVDTSKGNEAYSWGDHSKAGYLTEQDMVDLIGGTLQDFDSAMEHRIREKLDEAIARDFLEI